MTKAMAATAAIGISALMMSGCGSNSNDSADKRPTASTPVQSGTAAPAGTPSRTTGGSPKSGGDTTSTTKGATVLTVTASVKSAIKDAYLMKAMEAHPKEKQSNLTGPTDTHYGKVNGVYYAIGQIGFKDDSMSRQDGPHVWKSPNGSDWSYEGDTGGMLCSKVPSALVKAWGKSC